MEFLQEGLSSDLVFGIFTAGLFAFLCYIVIAALVADSVDEKANSISIVVGVGLFVVLIITGFILSDISRNDFKERSLALENQINELYDVKLETTNILSALKYPDTMPETDFKRYGTWTESKLVDDNLVETSVTLVWTDGEMRLYGLDENKEVGSELPRVSED